MSTGASTGQHEGAWINSTTGTPIIASFLAGTGSYALSTTAAIVVGGLDVQQGNVTIQDGTGGSFALSGSSIFSVSSGASLSLAAVIAGGGFNLTKTGAGALTLSGANTFSGSTSILAGSLNLSGNAPSGSSGTLGMATSPVLLGDTTGTADASLLVTGAYTVGRAVTIQSGNSGTVTLGGSNGSGTAIYSGAITLNKDLTISEGTGGTLSISGGITAGSAGTKTVTLNNSGTIDVGTTAISDGSGVVALSQAGAGTTTLAATNTYTGGTAVSAGTLNITGSLSSSGAITVNGGTLSLSNNQQVSSLSGSGGTISFAGKVLTVAQAGTTSYAGGLTGSGASLAKSGGGTLTLSGSNSYTGSTTITGGTLQFAATTSLPSSTPVTLNGGTLEVGVTGTFQTSGALTVSSLSTINFAPGVSNATLRFGASDTATWTGSGSVYVLVTNYAAGNTIRFGNDDTALTADQLAHISVDGFMAQWAAGNMGIIEASTTAIPEPATWAALAGLGVLALGCSRAVCRRAQATRAAQQRGSAA